MEIRALFLLFFVLLSGDAFGRSTEGASDQETNQEESVEIPSSEDSGEALTPWELRAGLSERRSQSLFTESQGHVQQDQGSSVAHTPGEGARVPVFPQAPSPALAPVPAAPASTPLSYIIRLVPVFMSSQFVGAPGGVNGLYSPPNPEPDTIINSAPPSAAHSSRVSHPCIKKCEFRNMNGKCEVNEICRFMMG
ncbi:uncharacterized protein LOC134771473 [Penaeus indicus]|uniref:uncharacterized protein LOC134771473 n=1 Tax=Penaeus indicus TaxID=29960 RepID=UPI00300C2F22